jgi:hypothetical protein
MEMRGGTILRNKDKKKTNNLWIALGMIHPEWIYLPPNIEEEIEAEEEKEEEKPTEQIRIHFHQRKEDKAP